jgi:hypothetical protein
MTKDELRELAKQTFGLVEPQNSEVVQENFATATLEDGTKITNDKGSEFAVGDKVFVEVDGEKKPAPEGDHITKSGMSITLDAESMITGMKRPDEAGEGSEGLAEEEEDMKSVTEEMAAEEVKSEDKVEETTEKFEEKVIEEEINMASLEDIIEVIGEVVEEKMKKMDERMKNIEEKMSSFASAPAEESVVASNFSKAKSNNDEKPLNDKRYFAMLEKLNTITKK